LEESEDIEELPAQPRQPQNFDDYVLPTTDFLTQPPPRIEQKDEELLAIAQELTDKTKEFNVTGRVMHICQGPVVRPTNSSRSGREILARNGFV
jgi:DNA segregation ATPase FtsK/SpoIIIE-like protein